jgi:hypothetical protein
VLVHLLRQNKAVRMSPEPSQRGTPLETLGLVLLVLAPLVYLGSLAWARTGNNLEFVLLLGSAAFVGVGVTLLVNGSNQGRSGRVRGGLAVLGSALLAAFIGGCGQYWYGSEPARLLVRVLDADTGRPIAHATVSLVREQTSPDEGTVGTTDARGFVCLTHEFDAAGTDSAVERTGALIIRETLSVQAQGYEGVCEPLHMHTGVQWGMYGPPLPGVAVHLHKK